MIVLIQAKRWKADDSGEPALAVRDAGSSIEKRAT
jgi:hypothetical protein